MQYDGGYLEAIQLLPVVFTTCIDLYSLGEEPFHGQCTVHMTDAQLSPPFPFTGTF